VGLCAGEIERGEDLGKILWTEMNSPFHAGTNSLPCGH
jgi:hypothetical protein